MPDYRKMYLTMMNAAENAIRLLPEGEAKELLIEAQRRCEEIYLETAEDEDAAE